MLEGVKTNDRTAPCGTTACIAGFAVILKSKPATKRDWKECGLELTGGFSEADWSNIADAANQNLGMSEFESLRLFYHWKWPAEFLTRYNLAKTRKQKAAVAIARIDHFIATKGAE